MIDSGHVPISNPFCSDTAHDLMGTDPVYGCIAGQGNHSLSTADIDGDDCMEIIYGGAAIDHDGSVLYSSYGIRPDGVKAKFGHGDAMHVAKIDPNTRGLQMWVKNVFDCEGNKLDVPLLGTNQSIRFAADLSTQILDGVQYIGTVQPGIVNDSTHGVMLEPQDTSTNNGTKGNPCLVAWQNNCYNQPGYTKFYYATDMDFAQVLPALEE